MRDWAGEKLKTRTKRADRSIEDIDELGKKVKEEEFHRLEEELLANPMTKIPVPKAPVKIINTFPLMNG